MTKRFGFTLAEVLITLAIIGVVAALTIPTLIKNIQKRETASAVKEAYSILSQVAASLTKDNGGSIKGIYAGPLEVRDAFAQYISSTTSCNGPPSNVTNCWSDQEKNWDGTTQWDISMGISRPYLVMKNGMAIKFENVWQNCDSQLGGSYTPNYPVCEFLSVDVNGLKQPNTDGKDIFFFWLTETTVKPGGAATENQFLDDCNPPTSSAVSCAQKILLDEDY